MKTNIKLIVELRKRGLRQRDFAKMIDERESKLSGVINGRLNLSDEEMDKWASALGLTANKIF